jgi:hypothetical protein
VRNRFSFERRAGYQSVGTLTTIDEQRPVQTPELPTSEYQLVGGPKNELIDKRRADVEAGEGVSSDVTLGDALAGVLSVGVCEVMRQGNVGKG